MAMKKILTLTAAALLTVSINQVFAQRTIKNVRFDGISLNISPDSFIEKLEKKDWKTVSVVSATDSQERSYVKTTLEGKVNGIDISATVIPEENLEKVSKIIMFTEADSALNKTRYDVIKSWLENQYDKPTVSDLKGGDGNMSCYWGDFKGGERDLQKNHISLTTVDGNFVVVTINNLETGLDATMNNIGDAIERAIRTIVLVDDFYLVIEVTNSCFRAEGIGKSTGVCRFLAIYKLTDIGCKVENMIGARQRAEYTAAILCAAFEESRIDRRIPHGNLLAFIDKASRMIFRRLHCNLAVDV